MSEEQSEKRDRAHGFIWHYQNMKVFVHADGRVFHFGIEQPHLKGTLESTPMPENKKEIKENSTGTTERVTATDPEIKKMVEIPLDLFEKLQERLQKLESNIHLDQQEQKTTKRTFGTVDEEFGRRKAINIPKDDFEVKEVKFVKFGRGWVVSSYYNGGEEVLAPYERPIVFRGSYSDVKSIGNDAFRVIPYCEYKTHSKKVIEFLRNSPYYKQHIIYDNATDAMNSDFDNVNKIEQATALVSRLSTSEVFGRAIDLHIDINLPESQLRGYILQNEVSKLESYVVAQKEKIRKEKIEEELFAGSTNK